jgi:allantoate deiminase
LKTETGLEQEDMQMTEQLIEWLGRYGADADGGVTRLLYTRSWKEAQEALAEKMKSLGLEPAFDDAGNLFGRLQGTDADSECILTGSHVDTVQRGGKYDGAYGIVAGIAALARLREKYGAPKKTIEVVAFCEEEGSRFPYNYWGSTFLTGAAGYKDVEHARDQQGISFMEAMKAAGFGPGSRGRGARTDIGAFIELHIEQGAILEQEGQTIGIVEQIVGLQRYTVRVKGEANHAGTTPMPYRRDAMRAAGEMVAAVMDGADEIGAPLVATVGRMELIPGTPNVIPGEVLFTMDVRHPDGAKLEEACAHFVGLLHEVASRRNVDIETERWMNTAPIAMDAELTDAIERICRSRDLPYRRMPSGAGHDAQILAACCRTAMAFVPSRKGISHSPLEYTEPEHLEAGVQVLTDLLHQLAY